MEKRTAQYRQKVDKINKTEQTQIWTIFGVIRKYDIFLNFKVFLILSEYDLRLH